MLRLEFDLKRHQREAEERGLLERKPSKPKWDCRTDGGAKIFGSKRKMISRELDEIK